MLSVGIVGSTGYTGSECVRLCLQHPELSISQLFSVNYVGQSPNTFFKTNHALPDVFELFDPQKDWSHLDVLFLALPHMMSHSFMLGLSQQDVKVIDLSADFRVKDPTIYESVYGIDHASKSLCADIPYGLPELYADNIRQASIVANPGCYATSIILGLYPLMQSNMSVDQIVVDAKSGVSGAGKKVKDAYLYCEVNEHISSYATGQHRHQIECDEHLGMSILFSPHLVPMMRGIMSSMYISFSEDYDYDQLLAFYQEFYKNAPFVLVSDEVVSSTKSVLGTNNCAIALVKVPNQRQCVIFSMIDNLMKGAAGQAIQNMNIMVGFPETMGLPMVASL